MLAIISDLHFCDGTAIDRNVESAAFDIALRDVYDTAADLAELSKSPTKLDVVFLGDVFDLLRTERWFQDASGKDVPLAERPWGDASALDGAMPTAATIARANGILDEIFAKNADALATLTAPPRHGHDRIEVRRFYVMGNHDRLLLHDAGLRARCFAELGASPPNGAADPAISLHRLLLPEYGLLARHGHEWDDWNFERFANQDPSLYTDEDYLPAPIGDPITTELVARLPFEVRRRLASTNIAEDQRDRIVKRLQRVEDVRPLPAVFHWIFQEASDIGTTLSAEDKKQLDGVVTDTVHTLAKDFLDLEFFQAWQSRHHKLLRPDSAALLHAALATFSSIGSKTVDVIAQFFGRFIPQDAPHDHCRAGAAAEKLAAVGAEGLRFVVYGHTHEAAQAALHAKATSDVYLNSGTFRQAIFRTDDQQGFIGWDRMTYLTFFTEPEQRQWKKSHVGPGFDVWSGARSR